MASDLGVTRFSFLGIDIDLLQAKARDAYKERKDVPTPPESELRASASGAARLAPLVQKRRILWVDDKPDWNLAPADFFRSLGIEVDTRTTTDEALEIAKEFDLVISNWVRAKQEEGPRLLERLRERGVRTPVLFYVGVVSTERYARAEELGAVGITRRPDELFKLALGELVGVD
jgi:CheY-like chemotaxis protein